MKANEQAESMQEVLAAATLASEKLKQQVEVEIGRADDAQSQVTEAQKALTEAEAYLAQQEGLARTVGFYHVWSHD